MSVPLLEEVLAAHGGRERWEAARTIRAEIRSGGLLLRTRLPGNKLAEYTADASVAEPRIVLDPFPMPGSRGVFERGAVRIEDGAGNTLSSRADPRPAFFGRSGIRRNLRWDALDSVYFAGYAVWNYLTTPLLLTRSEVTLAEGAPWTEGDQTWRRLVADFGPGIDTHSRRQVFYVDSSGLLRRHDYTAEVIGGWARAAHLLAEHRTCDGLVFPTRRRVRPVGPRGRPLPFPTLVWLAVERVRVEGE